MSDLKKWLGRVFKLNEGQLVVGPVPNPVVLSYEQGVEMLEFLTAKVQKCRPREKRSGSGEVQSST